MKVAPDILLRLQKEPESIRNICILAHVDHGKTSLSDSLLASNGIISQRLAGKVRYLDSRPDEQLRGITMESSAISLYFRVLHKQPDGEILAKEHLINLIDSPGHIDFSSEVSTASRLCDGAVVLVDVVEGVCSQTVTVLRQCWLDKLKPVLVLNKIDRLITELRLTPAEAYLHLSKTIEQVNSVLGSFFSGERMVDDYNYRERLEANAQAEYVERDDASIYFDPAKNNVIFASAIDGWGFNISQFARFYETKLGIKRENLQKVLWGDFYLDPKTKKVINSKGLKGRTLKPLFVSLVLENVWKIYENIVIEKNQEVLEKIVKALKIKVLPRDLRSKDNKNLLNLVMGQWLPVSSAVLLTVTESLPSPLESQKERIPTILESAPNHELIDPRLKEAMLECDNKGPVSAYVSKILSIPEDELPRNTRSAMTQDEIMERGRIAREQAAKAAEQAKILEADKGIIEEESLTNEISTVQISKDPFDMFEYEDESEEEEEIDLKKEELIGFARVYSGTLKVGQELSVLEPKYDPKDPTQHIQTATITELYLIMGKELVPLDEVPSGNIAGIGGLAGKILKNGTLIQPGVTGVNLAGVNLASHPIVRVSLEPVNPTQMEQLERGLQLLNQADPCVQTFVEDNGELILATAGELHLERCLKDLKERFAGIEIQSSEPVIPFRETFLQASDLKAPKNEELGRGVTAFELGNITVTLRAVPLPEEATQFIIDNQASVHEFVNQVKSKSDGDLEDDDDVVDNVATNSLLTAEFFKEKLQNILGQDSKNAEIWEGIVDKVVTFGPKRVGPNILFDTTKNNLFRKLFSKESTGADRFKFENSIINGFQLAISEGPLANEQVQGMSIIIESIMESDEDKLNSGAANLIGRIISSTKNTIHASLLDWSPRMMLATYTCDIQASAEVLGKVYSVVQRRRGRIVSEEMKEGTPFFQIVAKLPVVEAFGFSEDIRKKTSGAAQPQLVFSGFEAIDEDPFWVPTTEEELEKLGEFAERENIARKYMNSIRKRKGLFVEEKVVENAEKQRTLKRN